MKNCDYCEEEFEDEEQLHIHWMEEHADEITSHEKDKAKKAKRDKDERKRRAKEEQKNKIMAVAGTAGIVVLLVGIGYGAVSAGLLDGPDFEETTGHYHATFDLYIDGDRYQFDDPRYLERVQEIHLHDADNQIHSHRRGMTFQQFLNTIDLDYGEEYIETPDERHEGEVRLFHNHGDADGHEGWAEIDIRELEFTDQDKILLVLGEYSDEEIEDMQESVPPVTIDPAPGSSAA